MNMRSQFLHAIFARVADVNREIFSLNIAFKRPHPERDVSPARSTSDRSSLDSGDENSGCRCRLCVLSREWLVLFECFGLGAIPSAETSRVRQKMLCFLEEFG
jgi:hypothetical protein